MSNDWIYSLGVAFILWAIGSAAQGDKRIAARTGCTLFLFLILLPFLIRTIASTG